MDSQDQPRQFQFRLEDIVVTNFRIGYHHSEIDESKLGLEFGYNFTFNFEENEANAILHFKYVLNTNEPEKQKVLVHCDINFLYIILDLQKFVQDDTELYTMDTGLMANLLNIAFGTSRGIIYERTRGYMVNRFLLPPSALSVIMKHNTFPKPITSPIVSEPPS